MVGAIVLCRMAALATREDDYDGLAPLRMHDAPSQLALNVL